MSAVEDRKRERFWNQLFDLIAAGTVVPVVGEELLQITTSSGITTLYPELATRFAQRCDIKMTYSPKRVPYIRRKVEESGRTWEDEILNDFDQLEKNGL